MKESEGKPVRGQTLRVAEVIPVVRGMTKHSLSYFTKENLSAGSFVKVPIRSGEVTALVARTYDARSVKTDLKRASFALKRLSRHERAAGLTPGFMRAVEQTAEYYATTMSSVLGALIPKLFLEQPSLMSLSGIPDKGDEPAREPLLVQLPESDRYREYKSLIRGSFARKKSVLFIAPTHSDVERAYDFLGKGISDYVFMTARQTPKSLKEILERAQSSTHPILLITTPAFVAFDRPDLDTIILERENSRAYRTLSRPHIHIKVFLGYLAHQARKTLVLGDSVLSLETLWQEKQGRYAELSPLKWRITRDAHSMLVDMKAIAKREEENRAEFEIFSPQLKALIEKALAEKRKIFLLGVRRGLAPTTVCHDCNTVLSCQNCGAPMVLHLSGNESRIYLCHACGARRNAETRCDRCQSWNLVPLGIGIDRIAEVANKLFPTASISVLDKESAPTAARAAAIAKKFASQKGGIIIGTELAFLYLEKVPYAGLVSLDSLFSIPDFSIHERIFYLVTRLLEISEFETIIQTRNIGKQILGFAERGNVLDFYRSEIEERRELSYPPFSIFIKVTTEGSTAEIEKKAAYLKTIFADYAPDFIGGRGMKTGKLTLSMILRLPKADWPDTELRDKLLLLTPDFLIKVDPESIL